MSEISVWLAVGTGGAAGAVLRGLIFRAIERWSPMEAGGPLAEFGTAPSTVVVNMLGSLLLGLVVGNLPDPTADSSDPALAFWVTGLCGAVTTFSTLCADAIGLARRGHRVRIAVVLLANTMLGIAALLLGFAIAS
jgi:CrcB protein